MAANEAEVDLIVNAAGALPDLERQLSQIVRTAENDADAIDVDVAIQAREAARTLSSQIGAVVNTTQGQLDPIEVGVLIDQRDALQTLDRQLSEIVTLTNRGAVVDDPVLIQAVIDGPESLRNMRTELDRVVASVEQTAPEIEIEVDVDTDQVPRAERVLRALGRTSLTTAKGLGTVTKGMAGLSLAVGGGAQALAGLVAALQQVAPAAAVGTQAILAQKLATGTLKLAMVGVQDAIQDAFNPDISVEDFHKSLKKLAPEAALFVDQIHTIRRELKAVQQGVQNRVFKDFDELLRVLSRDLGPDVTRALNRTADTFNRMGKEVGIAALALDKQGVLGQALDGATTGLQNLEKVPARLATSFGLLAAASAPAFDRITAAVDRVAASVAERLQRSFASGALEESINKAVDTIGQLLTVVGNFGQAIGNIFGGLTQNGRGLFQILEDISVAFENLTASREFQTILGELAATADALVQNILPLIQEAFVQLGPVIEELAPVVRDFVNAIGPELIPIIQQLGPILVDIALILKEQLPLAIDLTNAAIDALGVALTIVSGFIGIARQASESFADFYQSDFVASFRAASNAAVTHRDVLKSAFQEWTASALGSILRFQGALGNFAAALRDKFVGAIVQSVGSAARALQSFAAEFISIVAQLPAKMFAIGAQIVSGLVGGLRANVGRVLSVARGIADAVSTTIESALDINSPSRVMRRIGRDTVEGFRLGMKDKIPGVKDLASSIATIATSVGPGPATVAVGNIGNLSGPQVGNIPKPTLERQRITNIYLGGRLIEQIIDDRIKAKSNQNVRVRSQGVRI